ncbi:MAG TPA: hypothetical protein VN416_09685, partial [Desulfomonilia bacterium]|nr:hypothetical protein [Desulfomonilia bacterium]
ITYRELFGAIAKKFGRQAPFMDIPRWALVAYGYVSELSAMFTGRPPDMNPGMARYMSVNAWYDSTKAVRDLGYRIVPVHTMIDDAYAWYRDNGFL